MTSCVPPSPCPLSSPDHSSTQVLVSADHNPRLPNGAVVAVLMVLGMVGNSLVLYVYHFRMPRSVFTTFVTVLAGLDLVTAVTGMPVDVVIKTVMLNRSAVTDAVCKLVHFQVYASSLASGGILLLIATTRHTKVCHPTRPGLTVRQARRLCAVVVLVAMALCTVALVINGMEKIRLAVGQRQEEDPAGNHTDSLVPLLGNETDAKPSNILQARSDWVSREASKQGHIELGLTTHRTVSDDNRRLIPHQAISDADRSLTAENTLTADRTVTEVVEVYICRTSEKRKGTGLYYALRAILTLAFAAILLSLVVLHCRISHSLSSFKHRRSIDSQASVHSDSQQHNLRHMTSTMFRVFFAITVIFVVSYLPHLVCLAVERGVFGQGVRVMSRGERVLMDLAYNFPYINVVANPFIYGYMSRRFRARCLRLLCRCCLPTCGSSHSEDK